MNKTKTRRQVNEANNKLLRKKQAKAKGKQPARDVKYLAFVRGLCCIACFPLTWDGVLKGEVTWDGAEDDGEYPNNCGPTEACHTGPHALSRKASDYTAVPLGRGHHEKIGSSIRKLEALGINYAALVKKLREAYEAQR